MLNESFWNLESNNVVTLLHSNQETGLTAKQATKLLKIIGPNQLQKKKKYIWLLQLISHLKNPLILLLLSVGAISFYLQEVTSCIIISIITAISVILDFYQEYKAISTIEAFKKLVELKATIIRDGVTQEIAAKKLVPGDIILLTDGDIVPADCMLLATKNLLVDQSSFTGEAYAVEKTQQMLNFPHNTVNLIEQKNIIFMGSTIIEGSGKAIVCQTGIKTEFNKMAVASSARPAVTAFELAVKDFGLFILRISIICSLIVLLINTLLYRTVLESLIFAVTLAVGITPELLPMIFTVTTAVAIKAMAKQQLIVKKPIAVQNLASMDVLCTDKTGTLTEGKVELKHAVNFANVEDDEIYKLAYINSYFQQSYHGILNDSIIKHKSFDISDYKKIDEISFDFSRRMLSVILKHNAEVVLFSKGSPENVLPCCGYYKDGNTILPLTAEIQQQIEQLYNDYFANGYRALGIAYTTFKSEQKDYTVLDEKNLVFAGLLIFVDPPKVSAKTALSLLQENGVNIKVITGDSEKVAQDICAKLNLKITEALDGSEIEHLTDKALSVKVTQANLYYKISPLQKSRIILALKQCGHVVGYLGDGINDIASLHTADVGIAVDTAVDAAKEASDIIMLNADLNLIYQGIMLARKSFVNIIKYLMVTTSSNFGNMLSMALGSLVLPFLPMLPVQILANNLLYDLAEVPLPLDNVKAEYLRSPKKLDLKFIYKFMLIFGAISSVFDMVTFYFLVYGIKLEPEVFRTVWFLQSLASQVLVIFILRTNDSIIENKPPMLLILTVFAVISCGLILTVSPFAGFFGFKMLSVNLLLFVLTMVGLYLVIINKVKHVFFSRNKFLSK